VRLLFLPRSSMVTKDEQLRKANQDHDDKGRDTIIHEGETEGISP